MRLVRPPRRLLAGVSVVWLLAVGPAGRADDGQSGATVEAAAPVNPTYPIAYIERPLTLPALMTEAELSAGYWWVEEEENVSTTRVTASFGLTDWWQASAWTRFYLKPDSEWGETVGVATRMRALDTARFDLAPGLSLPLLFDGDRDTWPVPAVTIHGRARIRVLRRTALYFGDNLAPFGLGDSESASIDLNSAVVSQFNEHLSMRLSAQIFHIRVYGDVRESSAGPGVFSMSLLMSPTNLIDVWLGYQLSSSSDGVVGGIAGRL